MDIEKALNLFIAVTVFGLVLSVWCICVFMWLGQYLSRVRKIQLRLGLGQAETAETKIMTLWRDARRAEENLTSADKLTLKERLRKTAHDAGWHTPAQIVLSGVLGAAVLAFVIGFILTGSTLVGLAVFTAVIVIFWTYTKGQINRRKGLFEKQLVEALGIASRSLRAGHPLVGAFQLVSEQIGEPLGSVFNKICQEQSLGLDLNDSIRKVARLTDNLELKLFSTAVAIQLHSGGNLADLMDTLTLITRQRTRLNRKVRVLTAQSRFSAKILVGLPVLLFFFLNAINPQYMAPLYNTTAGKYMLAAIIFSCLLGSWIMKRLSVLRI